MRRSDGRHRVELDRFARAQRLLGGLVGVGAQRLGAPLAVAVGVDHDPHLGRAVREDDPLRQVLDGVDRLPVPADEQADILALAGSPSARPRPPRPRPRRRARARRRSPRADLRAPPPGSRLLATSGVASRSRPSGALRSLIAACPSASSSCAAGAAEARGDSAAPRPRPPVPARPSRPPPRRAPGLPLGESSRRRRPGPFPARRRRRPDAPPNEVLLADRPQVRGDPVHQQTGRVAVQDHDEHERQQQHQAPLVGVGGGGGDQRRGELRADVEHDQHDQHRPGRLGGDVGDEQELGRARGDDVAAGFGQAFDRVAHDFDRMFGDLAVRGDRAVQFARVVARAAAGRRCPTSGRCAACRTAR